MAKDGIRRRGFLSAIGAGVVGGIAAGEAQVPPPEPSSSVMVILRVNGRPVSATVEPRCTLVEVLRERLGLTGTKVGCERGECGACTVLVDGEARYACLTLAVEAQGHEITTVEGLLHGEEPDVVQRAFIEEDAMQCGYCTPGQVMAAESLLRYKPNPTPAEIREGMSGNLCRCGCYDHIFKAVRRASVSPRSGAAL